MHRYFISVCLAFGLLAGPASASEDWRPLSESQILSALSGRTLIYGDAIQTFLPSGRTSYDAGRLTWGYWRVEQGKYCSQWPPSDLWACYDVESGANHIRFLDSDGTMTEGIYR